MGTTGGPTADELARRRAEYRATFEAQQRRHGDPEFMAWLHRQVELLDERVARAKPA